MREVHDLASRVLDQAGGGGGALNVKMEGQKGKGWSD